MSNIAETVESLLEQHDVAPSALESFLDVAESYQSFTYSDVSRDLTSGAWGLLIANDAVQSVNDGFTVEDPAAIREALSHASASRSTKGDTRDSHRSPAIETPMTDDGGQGSITYPEACGGSSRQTTVSIDWPSRTT